VPFLTKETLSKYKDEGSPKPGNFFCHTNTLINYNVTRFYCQAKSNDYVQEFYTISEELSGEDFQTRQ
jgi:hypothetical protein